MVQYVWYFEPTDRTGAPQIRILRESCGGHKMFIKLYGPDPILSCTEPAKPAVSEPLDSVYRVSKKQTFRQVFLFNSILFFSTQKQEFNHETLQY